MGDDIAQKADPWFEKIQKYVTGKIGAFVAFLFLLVAGGAALAMFVMEQWPQAAPMTIIVPAVAGIIAYYNRTFAVIAFAILMVGILII